MAFEEQIDVHSELHDLRTAAIKNFENKEINFIIKEKVEDYITNDYIYLIKLITTVIEKNEVETTQVLEFKIYDTEKQKETYNNKNFVLIRMV